MFNLSDYEEVKDRLPRFFEKYPDGRVYTELTDHTAPDLSVVVFRAVLYKDAEEQDKGLPLSTGWAFERAGEGTVNKTSHLENAETSSIGRALANIGMHGSQRPSREEMAKVERMTPPKTEHGGDPIPVAAAKPKPKPASRPEPDMGANILEYLRKRFFVVAREIGRDPEHEKERFKSAHKLASFNDANEEQLQDGIRRMEARK